MIFKSAGKTTGALTKSLLKEQARQIFMDIEYMQDNNPAYSLDDWENIKSKWSK